jgi:hypothetical protein
MSPIAVCKRRFNGVYKLLKVRRAAFKPLALFALGYILYLAALEKGFHLYLAPAGTKKFLRSA